MTTVHDQSLLFCHLTQVMHHQAELHPNTHKSLISINLKSGHHNEDARKTGKFRAYLGPVTKHLSIASIGDELLGKLKDEQKYREFDIGIY